MHYVLLTLATLAAAATGLPAQMTKIIPASAANRDGSTLTPYFSGYGAGRAQQIIAAPALAKVTAIINEVRLRADGSRLAAIPARKFSSLFLRLGYTSKTPATMDTTYANNRTGKQTLVFSGAFTLPAQNATTRPFNIVWKLARPYIWLATNGNLLVEWEVPGTPSKANYFLDAEVSSGSSGTWTSFGKQGPFKNAEVYRSTCPNPGKLTRGGAATLLVASFKKSYPAIAVWGFSRTSYGALKLPFDLTPLGAPNNFLNVSIDLALAMQVARNSSGWYAQSVLPIPNAPGLEGLTLFAQGLFIDPASNNFGIVFADGVAETLATGQPAQLVAHYDSTKTVGFKQPAGTAIVIQFEGVIR